MIGIHCGSFTNSEKETIFNKGILLNYPLNIINNEIRITEYAGKEEVKYGISFLGYKDYNNESKINQNHDDIESLNENNTELYINDKKYKFQKYFKPEEVGIYSIKIKFNKDIKDLSSMFAHFSNILNIDLSSFNPINAINMSSMLFCCKS